MMAGMDNGPAADADPAEDEAARQAAEVAVELTETDDPDDKPRIARALSAVVLVIVATVAVIGAPAIQTTKSPHIQWVGRCAPRSPRRSPARLRLFASGNRPLSA